MQFDYTESGDGPALLFIPGSYSTAAAWRGVQKALKGSYRVISTSLPGYGGTAEVRTHDDPSLDRIVAVLAAVADRAGGPVHLIGHSFGGHAVMSAALRAAFEIGSIVTFEANPVFTRRDGPDFAWRADMNAMCARFFDAWERGDADAAHHVIDFWSHPGFFDAMPEPVREYCRQTTESNVLDWKAAMTFTPLVTDFAAVTVPATLVRGELANRAIVEITRALAGAMPNATEHAVEGAGHFLISTHPDECAAIIDRHMASLPA